MDVRVNEIWIDIEMKEQCESSLEVADFSATAEGLEGNWIDAAAAIFHRHGFCILLNALGGQEISDVLQTCLEVEAEMLLLDPDRVGCRDAGRYSFGAAAKSGHMLHHPAWQHLLQARPVLMVLKKIFPEGFVFCGGGGDFVLGKTVNYQSLHSDLGPSRVPPECRSDQPPMILVNFTVQPITGENGALRVVPGRRVVVGKTDAPPCFSEEPEVLRQSKLCPLPPGAAIIRDLRLWHGGTPNSSNETRFLPSVEVMSLKYSQYISGPHSFGYTYCEVCKWHQCCFYYKDRRPCLPDSLFETLPLEVQKLCEHIRGPDVPVGLRQFARSQRSWEDGERSSRWKSWSWPSSEGSETDHRGGEGGAQSTSYHASYGWQRGWRSNDWSEAKTGSNAHSINAGSQRVWTPDASWEDKTENFAISLREGLAAAGSVLAKTLRVTVGVVLIAKGLRFLNFLFMTLEHRGGMAKLRLLKALPFASAEALSKVFWIFQHT
eukprot:s627_g33.t1